MKLVQLLGSALTATWIAAAATGCAGTSSAQKIRREADAKQTIIDAGNTCLKSLGSMNEVHWKNNGAFATSYDQLVELAPDPAEFRGIMVDCITDVEVEVSADGASYIIRGNAVKPAGAPLSYSGPAEPLGEPTSAEQQIIDAGTGCLEVLGELNDKHKATHGSFASTLDEVIANAAKPDELRSALPKCIAELQLETAADGASYTIRGKAVAPIAKPLSYEGPAK